MHKSVIIYLFISKIIWARIWIKVPYGCDIKKTSYFKSVKFYNLFGKLRQKGRLPKYDVRMLVSICLLVIFDSI